MTRILKILLAAALLLAACGGKQTVLSDTWSPGNKLGVGTAYTYDLAEGDNPAPSRVWFTITGAAITDFLYPTIQQANVRELSLLVAGPQGVRQESSPKNPIQAVIEYLDPQALAYRITTRDPDGEWEAVKEVVTDPEADSVIMRWRFTTTDTARRAYAYFVPHLGNSGYGDRLAVRDGAVIAWDEQAQVYAALMADPAPEKQSVGNLGASDGLADLSDGQMDWTYDSLPTVHYGAATLALPTDQAVTLVVGFGASESAARAAAQSTLQRGFDAVAEDYIARWHDYVSSLKSPEALDPLFWVSAMALKAHEDKTYHGAGVASLSSPWGECKTDDNPNDHGYRYVWPRDLYHVAQAFIALGDLDSARTTLAYLDDRLQRPDGSFPQNADVNGGANWSGLQMDEVADPILLAHALDALDRYASLVKPAADFIAETGPRTGQERWEENGGYSPHSIAAQIAALIAAADMAEHAGDSASAAKWRTLADEWERQLETWTFTTSGTLGDGRYFLRVTEGEPNDAQERIVIANGGGGQAMLAVVDVSALELVRLGVRAPGAPSILDTLPEIDAAILEQTPNGPGWHRYAFDSYGEPEPGRCPTGQGQLWPLFNGERGLYALAAGQPDDARAMLDGMERFANEGLMLPEQVFAETGEGTGSATPLAWAHAEYVLLALSIEKGRVLDLPAVVAEHYGNRP